MARLGSSDVPGLRSTLLQRWQDEQDREALKRTLYARASGISSAALDDVPLNLMRQADQEILRLVYLVRARVRLAEKLAAWRELIAE